MLNLIAKSNMGILFIFTLMIHISLILFSMSALTQVQVKRRAKRCRIMTISAMAQRL